ncbi:DUF1499 domain-containing protein [Oricola sp.]|uniref:DUF1499 domain-containing protein n=1 Tax=Oricola sp. TaxID=1979950 RepID=UPI003BA9A427
MTTTLVLAGILAALIAAFFAIGPANVWKRIAGDPDLGPFERSAPSRTGRPNDALMCTPGLCNGVEIDRELPGFDLEPEALIARIDTALKETGETAKRVDDGSNPARLRYVTWTARMGFPDTNSFEAVKLPDGGTGLVAYARAQLGYSDAGNNKRRLNGIVKALQR